MNLKNQHILTADQILSIDIIDKICALASRLEIIASRKKSTDILKGAILANLFFEPSTRTRVSFATAFHLLGGAVVDVNETSSSIVKGESLYDTSRVMSAYADVIVMRHPEEKAIAEFAAAAQVPVLNAGNGAGEHPSQALLDIYTILKERGETSLQTMQPLTIALVGDLKHGRTVHSLSKLLSLRGNFTFKLVAPKALQMPRQVIDLIKQRKNKVIETEDLKAGIKDADVIYMTRIQEERFATKKAFKQYAGKYSVDKAFYDKYARPDAILMHPLPRDSRLTNPELNYDLNNHANSAIFRQVQNGVAIRMALFCLVLGIEEKVFKHLTDVKWR